MNIIVNTFWNNKPITLEWIPADVNKLDDFKPITQAYGVFLNYQNEAAIVSDNDGYFWTLLGGTVEMGETIVQTLAREVMEEADLKIKDIKLLGLQKVTSQDKVYYQARFVCKISETLPQTIDPAKGKILTRKFVPLAKLNEFLDWGNIGEAIVNLAIKSNNYADK